MDIGDYRWLVSTSAAPWLDRAASDQGATVQLTTVLRKDLSATRTHLVLEQAELRKRAQSKFPQPERMFFTRKGLEQSTDLWVARYKARRFHVNAMVADLCCGIGGDTLALAERGPTIAVERDPVSALLVAANGDALGLGNQLQIIISDVVKFDLRCMNQWHIDPDRRPQGQRVSALDKSEPEVNVIAALLKENPRGMVKLAPAADSVENLLPAAALEWISRDGECRQLVWWQECENQPTNTRIATVLDRDGSVVRVVRGTAGPAEVGQIGRYVFEPDAAILAARLVGQFAAELQLKAIGQVDYLTGDSLVIDPGIASFEVMEAMPFDRKRLAGWLARRGIGRVEVKSRDRRSDANRVQRQLSSKGTDSATVLLATIQKQTWAIIAKRVSENR